MPPDNSKATIREVYKIVKGLEERFDRKFDRFETEIKNEITNHLKTQDGRITTLREQQATLKEQQDLWKGAVNLASVIYGFAGTIVGAVVAATVAYLLRR